MNQFQRLFTTEQANALLEALRPLVAQMLAAREQILAVQPSLEPVLNKAASNGGHRQSLAAVEGFERLLEVVEKIQSHGVVVKDVNLALLDFPSPREGRVVFLCWKYDEPLIAFWHEIDAGYSSRQPL